MQGLKKLLQGDREPIGVVLAGGCGGFLAAIYGEVVGQPILDDWRGWVFSVLLGMGAGFVGVYLRDVEKRKWTGTIALAVVCGFFWKPVFKAAGDYALETAEDVEARSIDEEALKLVQESRAIENSASPAAAQTNVLRAVTLLAKLPSVKRPEVKARAETAINAFVSAVVARPNVTNEVAKIETLRSVAEAAAEKTKLRLPAGLLISCAECPSPIPARIYCAATPSKALGREDLCSTFQKAGPKSLARGNPRLHSFHGQSLGRAWTGLIGWRTTFKLE